MVHSWPRRIVDAGDAAVSPAPNKDTFNMHLYSSMSQSPVYAW
jgi:hypothetical protein